MNEGSSLPQKNDTVSQPPPRDDNNGGDGVRGEIIMKREGGNAKIHFVNKGPTNLSKERKLEKKKRGGRGRRGIW